MIEENDVALEYNEEKHHFDVELTDEGFDLKGAVNLRNAVGIMIFSERRTNADDDFPNQGGYPGDVLNDIDEPNLGSKIWQLLRSKSLARHLPETEEDIKEALQELIDQGIAVSINVVAAYLGEVKQLLTFEVEIVRLTGENLRFNYVWEQPLFAN